MLILGLSAFYHDSAACLVRDGEIVAAAEEERFSRRKHDAGFPAGAVRYCLEAAGATAADLDLVVFYEKPLLKLERLLETWLHTAPRGFRAFAKALPVWLEDKLFLPRAIDRGLGGAYRGRFLFPEHHESHAASAFFPSPFEEAAILTLDGVGEWATASRGHGRGNRITLTDELRFPHSLGLLYSAFTYFCGFRVNSGEYKLMGLAPYGTPRFKDLILEHLLDLKPDGSFRLDLSYFDYLAGLRMTSRRMDALLGGPPRAAEAPLTEREMDLAASIQAVTEEIVLRMARDLHAQTGLDAIVLAGGVALNCVANGRLLREGPFSRIWIQPASGDSGGALGAALFAWHQLLDKPRTPGAGDAQRGSRLGPGLDSDSAAAALDRAGARYHRQPDQAATVALVARAIQDGKVVGVCEGRMEFGPRALGGRSILGDARSAKMQSQLNLQIKFRESFRPFAPAVLAAHAHEWFELPEGTESPYMLLVAGVHPSRRLAAEGPEPAGLERLRRPRSTIPAVTHVDGSARVQTVDPLRSPRFAALLARMLADTGCPVVINTSFNIRGEPIVCTAEDAYRCFLACDMDVLVIEDLVLWKAEQPAVPAARAAHLARFALD